MLLISPHITEPGRHVLANWKALDALECPLTKPSFVSKWDREKTSLMSSQRPGN